MVIHASSPATGKNTLRRSAQRAICHARCNVTAQNGRLAMRHALPRRRSFSQVALVAAQSSDGSVHSYTRPCIRPPYEACPECVQAPPFPSPCGLRLRGTRLLTSGKYLLQNRLRRCRLEEHTSEL